MDSDLLYHNNNWLIANIAYQAFRLKEQVKNFEKFSDGPEYQSGMEIERENNGRK